MIILIWNIVVFLLYAVDKWRAKKGVRRISETSLITAAFLLGGVGAMFGMVICNHKTSKLKFRILVPLSVVVGAVLWLGFSSGYID